MDWIQVAQNIIYWRNLVVIALNVKISYKAEKRPSELLSRSELGPRFMELAIAFRMFTNHSASMLHVLVIDVIASSICEGTGTGIVL
jgi:hypothetical protein